MALTSAQLATLKAAIVANPTMNNQPLTSAGAQAISVILNEQASPAFPVWRSDASVDAIIDSITWASYTPNDKVGSTDTDPTLSRKIGWLLEIQVKQMNLQLMLQGRSSINCGKATLRAGLRDAVIQVPSGASGAGTSPGGANGANVMTTCTRPARLVEKILAGPQETTGTVTANVLGYEGTISSDDVQAARELP
ncbi:MAG TPA: hypothetical protein PLU79_10770 [Burkholderiaceae bacterium]|nr:hypothetical protein [Burkholderiaceae bacterium]HNB43609.1 hypothetical protein [Burkholderiaceae bacterium]